MCGLFCSESAYDGPGMGPRKVGQELKGWQGGVSCSFYFFSFFSFLPFLGVAVNATSSFFHTAPAPHVGNSASTNRDTAFVGASGAFWVSPDLPYIRIRALEQVRAFRFCLRYPPGTMWPASSGLGPSISARS